MLTPSSEIAETCTRHELSRKEHIRTSLRDIGALGEGDQFQAGRNGGDVYRGRICSHCKAIECVLFCSTRVPYRLLPIYAAQHALFPFFYPDILLLCLWYRTSGALSKQVPSNIAWNRARENEKQWRRKIMARMAHFGHAAWVSHWLWDVHMWQLRTHELAIYKTQMHIPPWMIGRTDVSTYVVVGTWPPSFIAFLPELSTFSNFWDLLCRVVFSKWARNVCSGIRHASAPDRSRKKRCETQYPAPSSALCSDSGCPFHFQKITLWPRNHRVGETFPNGAWLPAISERNNKNRDKTRKFWRTLPGSFLSYFTPHTRRWSINDAGIPRVFVYSTKAMFRNCRAESRLFVWS